MSRGSPVVVRAAVVPPNVVALGYAVCHADQDPQLARELAANVAASLAGR